MILNGRPTAAAAENGRCQFCQDLTQIPSIERPNGKH